MVACDCRCRRRAHRLGGRRFASSSDDATCVSTSCSGVSSSQVAVEVQHQDGDQHQHAAEQRVQEELDRRVFAPRAAPDADQEVHRQQHHFPEHVEQEEVERQEDAQHARFQQQEQDAVGLDVLVDRPARAHRQHADERRQHDQRKADAVEAHEVVDVERRNPGQREGVLHARPRRRRTGRVGAGRRAAPSRRVSRNTTTVTASDDQLHRFGLVLAERTPAASAPKRRQEDDQAQEQNVGVHDRSIVRRLSRQLACRADREPV